ncbi:protein BIG GRAIN 1-like B [Bidens hawaiensis]|uniref:protein BIG GRAIN 1-like B n=1 Tax=Bidens hawaiensis TaxID=980011 RepID=UPI00404B1D5B
MTERYPPHRRKTPSFSSSLLDSILRSIDEPDLHKDNLHQQVHQHEWKWKNKLHISQTHLISEEEHAPNVPSLQWMEPLETQNKSNRNCYVWSSDKFGLDSSSSGTTPSTNRSLPNCQNSFKIIPKTKEAIFLNNNTQKASLSSTKLEGKFMNLTKLRAMKMYRDLKKVKQPISPGNRLSTFISSLFASSKIKQDTTMSCTSCMSKKQHSSSVKRSVRFYPVIDTIVLDRKSIDECYSNSKAMKNYKNSMVNIEDGDEDDLFELEIVGGQELPVFETTDLRKSRI